MNHKPVDVVIAVHTPTRPVGRAVASVLDGNGDDASVTVVCHNVDADTIAAEIAPRHRDRLTFLEHHDPRPSASGPFNAGMRAARGDYVSIMGSDDTLAPGAVASWLRLAARTGAEAVVTRLTLGPRRRQVRTPPTRPLRRGPLDPVKDRLSYRSAPLGLVARRTLDRLDLELLEGAQVGGDVPFVTRLWFEAPTAYDRRGPAYLIGESAADRVTYTRRPIATELAFVRHLLTQPWFERYPLAARRAVAAKVARIHLFGAVHNRPDPGWWTAEQRLALAQVAAQLSRAAPRYEDVLSVADRRLLHTIRVRAVGADDMLRLAMARRRHGAPATLVTASPTDVFRREAPLRLMAASALASVRL